MFSFKNTNMRVATLTLISLLAGCAQMHAVTDEGHIKETTEQFSRVDQHSSYPALSRSAFEHVNLLELIDPKGESISSGYRQSWSNQRQDGHDDASDIKIGQRYDLVLSWFTDQPEFGDWKRQRRNSVQDKILAVSTSRCNVFKTYLRRQQVEVNFNRTYFGSGSAEEQAGNRH